MPEENDNNSGSSGGNKFSLPIITRRNLMITTGVGVTGVNGLAQTSSAQKIGLKSESEAIFKEDFENHSTGAVPDDFVLAGNTDQEVVDQSASGSQSYRMSGTYGGCWEAIMRYDLFSESDRPDAMRIQGSFRLGNGSTGCHNNSDISWHTVASSSWSDGTGPSILNFAPDGTITSAGETVGKYNRYEWIDFTIEYEYDTDSEKVTQRCTIGEGDPTIVSRNQHNKESSLTALELKSGDYTVYWDDILIEQIDSIDGSLSKNLDPSISQSTGTATLNETVTFDASGSIGDIDSYDWQFGDGTTATGTSVSHSYEQSDTYTVTLTTTGADGTTATTSSEIVVAGEGELAFSIQPESPVVGQPATFEATGGDSYEWELGDETTASGQQVTHTYETEATYTVTLSSSSDSISRDLQVGQTPITITDITREFGGVPLQSVPYEETFRANIDSDNEIESVEFELSDQSKTASSTKNIPEATFDLSSLDESNNLTVTATDTDGFEATAQQTVAITPVPDWMEWLVETADVGVDLANTQIDITHNPLDLSGYNFSLGDIPIDTTPPGFDSATAGAEVAYDASQQAAVLDGEGGVDTELFGYGFEAELDIEGTINSQLALVEAAGSIFASVSGQVGPPLYVTVPPGVPCLDEQLGLETTVAPGIELAADFNGEFELDTGTVTPETVLTVGTELDICGTGAGAEVSGELDASFDIGTTNRNLRGSISGSGKAWVDISVLQTALDVGFEVMLPAETQQMTTQAQSSREPTWSVTDKYGDQPAITAAAVDAGSVSTADTSMSSLAPAADNSNGYQRLTDRPLEDTQPTMTTVGGETLVMWSSQRESATATAGRDIAYRITDSGEWSSSQYLTTETRSHEAPSVAASNGAALAVWEYVTTEIKEDTEPADIHPHIEIAYAIYDGDTWSETTVLTDSNNREFQPTVASTDNGWLIGWEQETDPEAGVGQRNVRYVKVNTDGTTTASTTVNNAAYPDTGTYPESGAVLGYASLSDGKPTATVSARIVDGSQTDSQQFSASAVRAVTVGSNRLIWQEGDVDDPTLIEGDREAGTIEELTVREAVTAIAEPSLSTDGDEAVLSYRAYIGSAETRELVYRLNRGSGWIFDRQFVQAPEPSQTVWQPETTLGTAEEQFKTAFAISETSQAGKNDIFLTTHDFLPEYAISATGPGGMTAGDSVTLEYTIKNRGDINGSQTVEVTVTNEGGDQAKNTYEPLAAGATLNDSVTVTVDKTGQFNLTIETLESSVTTTTESTTGFTAGSTNVRVATPQLRVDDITTVGSDSVEITIENTGGATAFDVPLQVTDGNNELTTTTISSVEYNDQTSMTVDIDPSTIDRSSEDRVIIDPNDTLSEAVSDQAQTTPTWLLQPDLGITDQIKYLNRSLSGLVAEVVVVNRSPVTGSGNLRAVTSDGTRIGSTDIVVSGSEQSGNYETIAMSLNGSAVSEGDEIEFRIAPSVPDADPSTISRTDKVGPILGSETVESQSIDNAIDENNNGEVDDIEVLQAIDYWQEKEPVPGTDDDTIGNSKILSLIEKWRTNSRE